MEILLGIIAIPIALVAILGISGVVFKIIGFFLELGASILGWFIKLFFSVGMLLLAVLGFAVLYSGFSEREPKKEVSVASVSDSVKVESKKKD